MAVSPGKAINTNATVALGPIGDPHSVKHAHANFANEDVFAQLQLNQAAS
jgi:hypothetical protein